MARFVAQLYKILKDSLQEQRDAVANDLRTLVILIAEHELGHTEAAFDVSHYSKILDDAGVKEARLRELVDKYKSNLRKDDLAKQYSALQAQAEAAEQKLRAADQEERNRRRDAMRFLATLEEDMQHKISRANAAMAARDDLISQAETTVEERELIVQLRLLNEKIAALDVKLNPTAPRPYPGGGCYMVGENPAAMVREARRDLAEIAKGKGKVNLSPERKAKIENTLRIAEAAVATLSKDRADLERERGQITARLESFTAAKRLPASFPLWRPATADEVRKSTAVRLGFGPRPGEVNG